MPTVFKRGGRGGTKRWCQASWAWRRACDVAEAFTEFLLLSSRTSTGCTLKNKRLDDSMSS
jgi:hypothetical protein